MLWINTSDSTITSPDAQLVFLSAQMEHGAVTSDSTEPKFISPRNVLFALAACLHLNFTPGTKITKACHFQRIVFLSIAFQNVKQWF